MYWSLACCLSLFCRDPDRLLAWNGRVLIGLTFLFATGWKIMGGEFLDGSSSTSRFSPMRLSKSMSWFSAGWPLMTSALTENCCVR